MTGPVEPAGEIEGWGGGTGVELAFAQHTNLLSPPSRPANSHMASLPITNSREVQCDNMFHQVNHHLVYT